MLNSQRIIEQSVDDFVEEMENGKFWGISMIKTIQIALFKCFSITLVLIENHNSNYYYFIVWWFSYAKRGFPIVMFARTCGCAGSWCHWSIGEPRTGSNTRIIQTFRAGTEEVPPNPSTFPRKSSNMNTKLLEQILINRYILCGFMHGIIQFHV